MTAKRQKPQELRERWQGIADVGVEGSPFGHTQNGLLDFRGCGLESETFRDATLRNVDFSHATLPKLRLKRCKIIECIFDNCDMRESYFVNTSFSKCSFRKSDMRWALVDLPASSFYRCDFSGARLTKFNIRGAEFYDMTFGGKNWSHKDFGASFFSNCRFVGAFRDIIFRVHPDSYIDTAAVQDPARVGFKDVDFSIAALNWVDLRGHFEQMDIVLPEDGSARIEVVAEIPRLISDLRWSEKEREMLFGFVKFFGLEIKESSHVFVTKEDFAALFGETDGENLFMKWKQVGC